MQTLLALAMMIGLALAGPVGAHALEDIELPAPRQTGGMPLMQALADRHTSREFAERDLASQTLADLLWAAFGINRPDSGKRTAPSARNWQEIEIYVVTAQGAYRYDAAANALRAAVDGDLRGATGRQAFAAQAPVNLVYVADVERMRGAAEEDVPLYAGADTGFISQNVYLYCASAGLATVVRGNVDRTALAAALGLDEHHRVILAQTVGHPAQP